MAPKAAHHINFIRKFKGAGFARRKQYLKDASDEQIKSLIDCTLNICNGNVCLSGRQHKGLQPHKHILKKLSFTKVSLPTKRRLLIQKGGFLPTLAAVAIPALASLIGSYL